MNKEVSIVVYIYGLDDDDVYEEVVDLVFVEVVREVIRGISEFNGDVVYISGKSCRCGLKEYERISYFLCYVNLKN